MRSMFSRRVKFGPQIQMQSISGAATIASIDGYACASPTRRVRASAAASSARSRLGLHTPRMSASRTPCHARMWNRALNPLPMKPTPSRPRPIVSPPAGECIIPVNIISH
jgi:hypothetical protein